jgi:CRISPR/Cas system-associated endonuclease Cas1
MEKALYINQTNKPVVMRDGPSVWVTEEGRAGRRIPVRLINRVVIIGNVRVDAGAIMLFSSSNIPITFLDSRAKETAVVIPYNHRLPKHYKEQKILLASEDNIRRYKKWVNSRRTLIQLNFVKRFLPGLFKILRHKGFGEGNYQEILKGIRRVSEDKWHVINNVVVEIFRNMIIERLIKADIDPHLGVIHRRHNFGLALDICYIMGGEIDIQSVQFFRSDKKRDMMVRKDNHWIITDKGIKNIVHRFENRYNENKRLLEEIIDELFELIREMST